MQDFRLKKITETDTDTLNNITKFQKDPVNILRNKKFQSWRIEHNPRGRMRTGLSLMLFF